MAQEIDLQVRFTAEDMYVKQRMTYDAIATDLGVSVNTVKRWGADGDWKTRRAENLRQRRALSQKLSDLRDAMMDQALASQNPQQAFAALQILKMEQDQERRAQDKAAPEIDRPKIFLEDLEWIAQVLKETDPEGLKVLARNFDNLTDRYKAECLNA